MDLFQVVQVDDDGRLFISPAIESWEAVAEHGIDTVIDLEGGLELPCMIRLRAIARLAASLIAEGHRVLSQRRIRGLPDRTDGHVAATASAPACNRRW